MSWSVHALGKPPAVAKTIAEQFSRVTCKEPEETIKNTVAGVIAAALAAFPPDMPVKVSASGSQYEAGETRANTLAVQIEPMWNFVE